MIRSSLYLSVQSIRRTQRSAFRRFIEDALKRLFDIMAALLGLILLLPFFAWIAIVIKRDSPGPVFYWGPRMGCKGKPFKILKFRTMYETARSYAGPRVTAKGDDRITRVGQWLRDTKVNELPQLWNVLVGEMSLVGPRPEDIKIAEEWPEENRKEILSVRPGITSPASVLYHDEETLMNSENVMEDYFEDILPDKMRLDMLYVRNRSFGADIDIIFWTFVVLLPRWTSSGIPDGHFFSGPVSRLFNRYVAWFVLDFFAALAASLITAWEWRITGGGMFDFWQLAFLSFAITWFFNVLNGVFGLNRIYWSKAYVEDALGLVLTSTATLIIVLALGYLRVYEKWIPYPNLPAQMIFTIGIISSIGFIILRYRLRLLSGISSLWMRSRRKSLVSSERVLIVGSGEGSEIANWLLKRSIFAPAFSIAGQIADDDLSAQGMRLSGCLVLGGMRDLPNVITKHEIDVVVMAIPHANDAVHHHIERVCGEKNVRLVLLSDLIDKLGQQITRPTHRKATNLYFD